MRNGLLSLLLCRLGAFALALSLCSWQTQLLLLLTCYMLAVSCTLALLHIRLLLTQSYAGIRSALQSALHTFLWTYTGTVLLGSTLVSYETASVAVLLAFEWEASRVVGFNGYWAVAGAVLAASQLPLDWDFEAAWQVHPYPEVAVLSTTQTVGLVAALLA